MSKNVLVISSSLRANSNSESLARAFAEGAVQAGNSCEIISLKDKKIAFCMGCLACQKISHCVIADDALEITEKMKNADCIAFVTPIYYYEMAGQLKTVLDRANSLYPSDYSFRDIYFLSCAAEDEKETPERAQAGIEGWIDCFDKARLAGSVFAGGVNKAGEIDGHSAIDEAKKLGASIK